MMLGSLIRKIYTHGYDGYYSVKITLDQSILMDTEKVLLQLQKSKDYILRYCTHDQ